MAVSNPGRRPTPSHRSEPLPFDKFGDIAQAIVPSSRTNDPRVATERGGWPHEGHYSARMLQALLIHPDSRSAAVRGIDVEAWRKFPGVLALRFIVSGNVEKLNLPPVVASTRTDELWRHTCFEVFVRTSPGGAYYEFNFAPSTQWAAYRFTGYRTQMSAPSAIRAPDIKVLMSVERYELRASLELGGLPDLPIDAPWQVGLSNVIEEVGGAKSYWALAHPPGRADFHHSDSFSLELPAM